MMNLKVNAHIHSLDGNMDNVTIVCKQRIFGHEINNSYIANYKGTLCTAVFNCFTGSYYVDDLDGIISENDENYKFAKRSIKC